VFLVVLDQFVSSSGLSLDMQMGLLRDSELQSTGCV
jgi:hypothetical protein